MKDIKRSSGGGSAARLLLVLCGSIFVSELLVMLLLDMLPPLSRWGEALLDSTLLSIPVFPMIYFLVFRPLRVQLAERQRTEAALRQSEEHYRTVTDSANDAIITVDAAGNIVGWNRGAELTFGYAGAEVLGQPLTRLMPQFYRDPHAEGLSRVEAGGARHVIGKTVELEGLRKDGSAFPLELSLADWQTDAGHFYTGIIRDITERKQAETALRDSEALYQSLVSHLSQCVLRKDREGRFTFANQRFCRLLGKTPAEIQGRTDFDFFPRELAEKYRQDDQRVMQERLELEEVEENVLPNGERIFVQVVKAPLVNAAGDVVGVQGIFWDITERKRAEQKREKLIGELKAALAQVKPLGGLLPICAGCKKIRDDNGYWSQVESYISKHTDAQFTHGYCPECIKKYSRSNP